MTEDGVLGTVTFEIIAQPSAEEAFTLELIDSLDVFLHTMDEYLECVPKTLQFGCEHSFSEPDCTLPGVCTKCGFVGLEPLGHDWQSATCTVPSSCSRCGEIRSEDLLPHTPGTINIQPPLCETDGSKTVCCSACGLTMLHTVLPATGHTMVDGVCSACGYTEKRRFLYGDADGSGEVNSKDITLLSRWLAGWEIPVDAEALDLNGDGNCSSADSVILKRYLAGWQQKYPVGEYND